MLRKTILVLIGLAGLFALMLTDQYFRESQHIQNTNEIENSKRAIFERLTQDVQERISVIEDMKAYLVSQKSTVNSGHFSSYAKIMMQNHPGIDNVFVLNVDTGSVQTVSVAGGSIYKKLSRYMKIYKPYIQDALQNNKTSLTDPVIERDGVSHIIAWVPLQQSQSGGRLIGGLFEISTLLNDLPFTSDPRMQLSLRDRNGRLFWGKPLQAKNLVPTIIPFGDNHWILNMGWRENPPVIDVYVLLLIWGMGGALLLSLLYIINRTWSRHELLVHDVDEKTAKLKMANERLQKEIEFRKVSEQALQETEQRLRATFDQAAVGIAQVSTAGVFTQVNRKICEILGYSEAELSGSKVEDFVHQGDRDSEIIQSQPILSGQVSSYEMVKRFLHKKGDTIWVNIGVSLVKDAQGLPRYFVMVMEDITPRVRAEEIAKLRQDELTHAARLATMGEMASGLAHEINQPLSAIVNYSSGSIRRMESGRLGERETRDVMRMINQQAGRAAEIMKRLRDFVRKTEPARARLKLVDVIENVMRFVETEARTAGVAINIKIEPDLPEVYADAIQIEQVLLNLVRNALDAMLTPETKVRQLEIEAIRYGESEVLVSVSDTGPGIESELREKVFDPFVTTKKNGTGLGLSISKSLVEAHDGSLWMHSNESGEGVVFLFTLPVGRR